jgi:hypothetical protein
MNEIQQAKEVLRNAGYFVDNLWHVDDVTNIESSLSKDQSIKVLDMALTNEATMDQIWMSIQIATEILTEELK